MSMMAILTIVTIGKKTYLIRLPNRWQVGQSDQTGIISTCYISLDCSQKAPPCMLLRRAPG